VGDPGSTSGAVECECRRGTKATHLLEQARIPKRFLRCEFENYHGISPRQVLAKQQAERFAREYPLPEYGLLLMGEPGVGKTHLAVAILNYLIREKAVACLFCDFQDLLKEIQSSYNADSGVSESAVLQPIFQTEVLVLDDLGARKPSAWVADTLSHIISTRYNHVRTTLFTTNFLDQPVRKEDATLTERISERVRSRLHEMCRTVDISGDDFRKKAHRDRVDFLSGK
jgi:DNA replication protein DnaC